MTTPPSNCPDHPATAAVSLGVSGWILFAALTLIVLLGTRPYASGSNDGGRLATVEALVDYHTFAIDDSIFARRLPDGLPLSQRPYPLNEHPNLKEGTGDKALISGRFYSDKPPVAALWMAGVYQLLQWTTGLSVRQQPGSFSYWMSLTTSGIAYLFAVWGIWRLAKALHLTHLWALLLTASFALSTTSLPYALQVNGHILSLAAASLLISSLAAVGDARPGPWRLAGWGSLCGLAYCAEVPSGGLLGVMTAVYFLARYRHPVDVVWFSLGVLPWALVHHAIGYSIAGTFRPIGAVPEFFDYPGSEFDVTNLTGFWNHESLWDFLYYAGSVLFGPQGFLLSNLPLLVAIPAALLLLWRRVPETPLLILCCAWSVATWFIYTALSTNYAGWCCSIRWFVPLLVPGYLALGLMVRDLPRYRADFVITSIMGSVLCALMAWNGPWEAIVPFFWPVQAVGLATWLTFHAFNWRLSFAVAPHLAPNDRRDAYQHPHQ